MDSKKQKAVLCEGSMFIINKKPFIIVIIIVAFFVGLAIKNTIKENSLIENGIRTKALIYDIKKVGGKGIVRFSYHFNAEGKQFRGFVDNENYKMGDSIIVVYKKGAPSYNRDYYHIMNYYNNH